MPSSVPVLDAHIRLFGSVDDQMFRTFSEQLAQARQKVDADKAIVLELTTTGGDADTGRRIATDIRLCRQQEGRTLRFLGKASVYSAGITIMAAFPASQRYLARGTELLIHERRITQTVQLNGALRSCMGQLRDQLAALESGQRLEDDGFREFVEGSSMTVQQVLDKVLACDWYLTAEEAVKRGLAHSVV